MKCLLCGHELSEELSVCPFCGARIEDEEEDSVDLDFTDVLFEPSADTVNMPESERLGSPAVILTREKTGEMIEIRSFPAILGRSSRCDFVLKGNSLISRQHLRIEAGEDGRIFLTDLQSSNGTRLDDRKVKGAAELPENAELVLADERFWVRKKSIKLQ